MKKILTFAIVLLCLSISCKDNGLDLKNSSGTIVVNSLYQKLNGKWMFAESWGCFSHQTFTEKDGIYLIFYSDKTFESYDHDTLCIKDKFEIRWDKEYDEATEKSYLLVLNGYPSLYFHNDTMQTVNYMVFNISNINDNSLELSYGTNGYNYKKVK
jgi:hypothetical protein